MAGERKCSFFKVLMGINPVEMGEPCSSMIIARDYKPRCRPKMEGYFPMGVGKS